MSKALEMSSCVNCSAGAFCGTGVLLFEGHIFTGVGGPESASNDAPSEKGFAVIKGAPGHVLVRQLDDFTVSGVYGSGALETKAPAY